MLVRQKHTKQGNFRMKKKVVPFLLIWLTIILLFIASQYTQNIYGLNLLKYTKYSSPLTAQEKTYLENKKTIYYVGDQSAPPFSFVNSSTGQYQGLTLDYAAALSLVLGIDVEFVPAEWNDAVKSLKSGDSDICDMYPSKAREKYFVFSDSIYWMQALVATRTADTEINNLYDLNGKTIGIPSGDYAVEYARGHLQNSTIVETANLSESINQLMSGQIDAVIGDEPVLIYLSKSKISNNEIKILDEPLFSKDVCFALNDSDTELLEIINKGIFQLKKQHILQNIQQKWFGISTSIEASKTPERILIGSLVIINFLLMIFVVTAIYSKRLKDEVTKRTQELYSSQNILQMTLDALPAYLIALRTDGIILNVNEGFSEQAKMKKNLIIGRKYNCFPFLEYVYSLYSIQPGIVTPLRSKIMQYEERHFNISIIPLHAENQILIVANDITNEIINHKQMLQDNKMIAVGQLATGVAHEIRNPLGNIRNYSFILKNKLEITDDIIEKCFYVIESAVARASNIINNLLNFSRISDNNYQLTFLKDIFGTIMSLEYDVLSKNNITIDFEYDKLLQIPINIESLNLILLNLISNSMDAMPNGGMITIKCVIDDKTLFMEFADTGMGIPPEKTEQIFNPFFTTKKIGYGTGLGLYIVYTEIKNMGGEVKVDSTVGEGTTFKFEIPIKEVGFND